MNTFYLFKMNIYNIVNRSCFQLSKGVSPASYNFLIPSFLPNSNLQTRGVKDQIKEKGITWNEPKKMKFYNPEKTCDLKLFDAPDKTRPTIWMRYAMDEYDESPVIVQKLLSVEFAARNHLLTVAKYDVLRKVQRHQYDTGSMQAQVGKFTCYIRFMQLGENQFLLHRFSERRVALKHIIDRRKKYLKIIRKNDYKLFEWLLEELDIIYKPLPLTSGTIYRYDSLRKLVGMHCTNIRSVKLAKYKEELEKRRPAFLKKKHETLQWIKEIEKTLGLPVSVNVEEGVIKPKEVKHQTVWDRIFGPFIDDPPLRDFDWKYPDDWVEEYKSLNGTKQTAENKENTA